MTRNKYTVDYFINKFSAIPECRWAVGEYSNRLTRNKCALGHCGVTEPRLHTLEADELQDLFDRTICMHPIAVNDGSDKCASVYCLGRTPKQRILNALLLIKAGVTL